MRENNEDWHKHLQRLKIEIVGLHCIFEMDENYLLLLTILEGLDEVEVDFETYRSKVFEAINLLRESYKNVKDS